MSNPYPWSKEKTHQRTIQLTDKLKVVTYPLLLALSLALHPAGAALAAHTYYTYIKHNHPPQNATRKLALIGTALLTLNLLTWSAPWAGTVTLTNFLTGAETPGFLGWARILFSGAGTSILLAAPVASLAIWSYEYKTRAYLQKTKMANASSTTQDNTFKPTRAQVRRQAENEELIKNPPNHDNLYIGTVAHDPLPWRTHRYGYKVGIPFSEFSHSIVLGATGTGKSVFLSNLAEQAVGASMAACFLNFKGDATMENTLAAIAEKEGVPFYSFWSTETNDRGFRFDPLAQVDNVDQASVLTSALGIKAEGDGAIYAETVQEFLGLQFATMKLGEELGGVFGRREGESVADYLLRVGDEDSLRNELNSITTNLDKATQNRINEIKQRLNRDTKKRNVERLTVNLSKLIGILGTTMRPHENPERNIKLEDAINQGAIIHFGMPPGANEIGLRVLGGLLLRNFAALASERGQKASRGEPVGVPVAIISDETQRLGDLAELATEIPQQGRSSKMFLISSSQTFQTVSTDFTGEMKGNIKAVIVLNTTHPETVEQFTNPKGVFGSMNQLKMMRGSETEAGAIAGENREHTGRTTTEVIAGERIDYDLVTELPPQHALVYFPPSPNNALLDKAPQRIRKDETEKDIPVVKLISKDYILAAANDPTAVERRMKELAASDRKVGVSRDERKPEKGSVSTLSPMGSVKVKDTGVTVAASSVVATPVQPAPSTASSQPEDDGMNLSDW